MGSKVGMLAGSLGAELLELAPGHERFVDLFAGSGAVGRFVATQVPVPVVAIDLMQFSGVISGATLERTSAIDADRLFTAWHGRARDWMREHEDLRAAAAALSGPITENDVFSGRALCEVRVRDAFIWSDYGGYYYSPLQALYLSAFHATLPPRAPHRVIALAALLRTASRASASPGHTAQPFRPTERLLPHLRSAWKIDIANEISRQVQTMASNHAQVKGKTVTGDGVAYASSRVHKRDLVFCDPPYSEAQYSRFYHVLEGIARGGWGAIHGAGRAPAGAERPSSDFSRRTRAVAATEQLLTALGRQGATVLWTYPEGERSNGLTVEAIRDHAAPHFNISETRIPMRHSTLGGSKTHDKGRLGRKDLHEVIFRFESKTGSVR
jgi:adenine-specific DNA-methyltransferase